MSVRTYTLLGSPARQPHESISQPLIDAIHRDQGEEDDANVSASDGEEDDANTCACSSCCKCVQQRW